MEFWKQNEHCQPPKEVEFLIRNVTDNVDLPPLTVKNTGTGVYDAAGDIEVSKDTDFEVTVIGGQDGACARVKGTLRVDVVDAGDFRNLCFSGPLACTAAGSKEHLGYEPFGPGVLIERVENLDSLKVGVRKDKTTDHLDPYFKYGTAFTGLPASGQWAIWLESEADCKIYNARPADAQKLCLNVYLQCRCQ